MNSVKEWWQKFRQWQHKPLLYKEMTNEEHVCLNCGQEFVGDYCPRCSQSAKVSKKIGWDTIGLSLMEAFNFNARSLPRTLWHLVCRPGYLIGDYISGRRQVSYPPMKMFLIVAICIVLIDTLREWMGWEEADEEMHAANGMMESISIWADNNPGWVMLAICSLFIPPTWLLFRYAPRYSHHTIPEGFFIQVFMTSLTMLIVMLTYIYDWFAWLVLVYYIVTYHQLFGYSIWGTTWRILVILFEIFLFLILVAILVAIGMYTDSVSDLKPRPIAITMLMIIIFVLIGAAVAAIANKINKIRTGNR